MKEKRPSPVMRLLQWAGPERKWLILSVLCAFGSGILVISFLYGKKTNSITKEMILARIRLFSIWMSLSRIVVYALPAIWAQQFHRINHSDQ